MIAFPEGVQERRLEMVRRELMDRVKAKIAGTIRNACAHMSPEEFDALVTRMAHIEIKYNTRRTNDLFEGVSERDQGPADAAPADTTWADMKSANGSPADTTSADKKLPDVSPPDDPPAPAPTAEQQAR